MFSVDFAGFLIEAGVFCDPVAGRYRDGLIGQQLRALNFRICFEIIFELVDMLATEKQIFFGLDNENKYVVVEQLISV